MKKLGIFFLALCVCACTVFLLVRPVHAADVETTAEIPSTYVVGDRITIPDALLQYEGQSIAPTSTVVFLPDGSATVATEFVAAQHGVYTVRWSAKVNGKNIRAEKSFTVQQNVVSFSDALSSYYYGKNTEYKTAGLNVSIRFGDECRINRIVDLSKCTFEQSFIDFSFTPVNLGTADAYRVYMKLTDAYDADNYVIVRMQNWSDMGGWADGFCYIDARAADQEWTSSVELAYNHNKRGENGKGWYMTYISMTGVESNDASLRKYDTMRIFYDAAGKRMITNSNAYGSDCMIDFDEAMWYDLTKEKLWDGFTTGECYVSFYADRYNSGSVNLCISKLLDLDLSEGDPDTIPPQISVNYGGEAEETLPYAIAGEKYRLFPASAYDTVDGDCRVIANVYRDFDGTRCIYDVKDGCFTPDKAGNYTILYAAKDASGNRATKRVDVLCRESANALAVNIRSPKAQSYAGESCRLFESVASTENNGQVVYTVTVSSADGKTHWNVSPDDPVVTPVNSGTYLVTVTAKDYVISVEKAYALNVLENPNPLFDSDPVAPNYLIAQASYSFDLPETYRLVSGERIAVPCKIYVKENGGARKEISSVYRPETDGTVELIFSAEYNGNRTEKSVRSRVIDVGYGSELRLDRYFYDAEEKIRIELNEDDIRLVAREDGSVDFIHKLQATDLTVLFDADPDYNRMNEITVLLTDSVDPSVRLLVCYQKAAGGTAFSLNGSDLSKMLSADFNGNSGEKLMLSYDNIHRKVYGSNDVYWNITTDMNGNEFAGFPSGYVYVTIGVGDVSGTSKVKLYSINNQPLYHFTRDSVKPQIIVNSGIGQKTIGDRVTISGAVFSDVLDPTLRYSFFVRDPNGDYVKSVEGVTLDSSASPLRDWTFTVDLYGEYYISYECYDSTNSRPTYYSFVFESVDQQAPTVTLKNGTTSAKVGETVKIAEADIRDNVSENCTVRVVLLDPNSVMNMIGESFTAQIAGNYIVYYYAYDEQGNAAVVSYTVAVTD